MLIDREKIIADIRGEKYHHYILHFPSLKNDIEGIKDNPSYHFALAKYVSIKKHPNVRKKLKTIYGEDCIIELEPTKASIRRVIDVLTIDENKYTEWFKTFMRNDQISIIFFDSCYNIENKQFIISIVYTEIVT